MREEITDKNRERPQNEKIVTSGLVQKGAAMKGGRKLRVAVFAGVALLAANVLVMGESTKSSILKSPFARLKKPKVERPQVKWQSDLEIAHQISVEEGKPLLIVFGARWCTYCKKMEHETLSEPRMVDYVNKNFVAVHLDYDKDEEVARTLEVKSIPCTVVLSPDADLLGKFVGYEETKKYRKHLESSQKLLQQIQQVSGNASVKAGAQ